VSTPLALQIAANLLSLGVALWLGWSPALILLLFWAENIVVALWQLPRILLAGGRKRRLMAGLMEHALETNKDSASTPTEVARAALLELDRHLPRINNFFVAAFFLVHYGFFTFGHGVFVFQLFLHQEMTLDNVLAFFSQKGVMLALVGLMVSHGANFFSDLASGRLATANPAKVMGEPYHRIVVLHLVVLGSAFALTFLDAPVAGIVILALVKTFMDVYLYRKQQKKKELPEYVSQL
jgi:hypothetical protein